LIGGCFILLASLLTNSRHGFTLLLTSIIRPFPIYFLLPCGAASRPFTENLKDVI